MSRRQHLRRLYRLQQRLQCPWTAISSLTTEQLDFIGHFLKFPLMLEACPGSGKTQVIGVKVAYEIRKWQQPNAGMAVLTFTKSAAHQLASRIEQFAGNAGLDFPHFVGTFDSWLHGYLLQPYAQYMIHPTHQKKDKSIQIIDGDNQPGFLVNYQTDIYSNLRKIPLTVTDYSFDVSFTTVIPANDKVAGLLQSASTKELKLLKENKKKFIKAGFATYADAEMMCALLLRDYHFLPTILAKRFPVILIDECQDLSKNQIDLLELLHQHGSSVCFIGDLNQAIYEFRKVNPNDLIQFLAARSIRKKILSQNFRSCPAIVKVCQQILASKQVIISHYSGKVSNACVIWQYQEDTFDELPKRFAERLADHNILVKEAVIVSRGKSTTDGWRQQFSAFDLSKVELIALAVHNWHMPKKTGQEIKNAITYLGRALNLLAYQGMGASRQHYCPTGMEAIWWRMLLKKILDSSASIAQSCDGGVTWSEWCREVKVWLQQIWPSLANALTSYDQAKSKIISPKGTKDKPVKIIFTVAQLPNPFRTTTIHSVKGETIEAVMLVSHKNKVSQGGHFSHWFKSTNNNEEHIRFAYVACSRARSLLVVATPMLNAAEINQFEQMGFKVE